MEICKRIFPRVFPFLRSFRLWTFEIMDTNIFKGICCFLRTFVAYLRAFFAFQFLFLQSNILKTLMARFSEKLILRAEKCNSFIEDKPHGTVSSNTRTMLHVPCHFHMRRKYYGLLTYWSFSELKEILCHLIYSFPNSTWRCEIIGSSPLHKHFFFIMEMCVLLLTLL